MSDTLTRQSFAFLPYGRHRIDQDDIAAVVEALSSDWLTTGPKVGEFERTVSDFVGAPHAVAVSSGTAALHAAMHALGIAPGDEVIIPPLTFAASANCVLYQGGTPVFADVHGDTLLLDPEEVERRITPRTRAIVAVDYAGQPCDYDVLRALAGQHKIPLVADACHALGARYKGVPVGQLADLTVFSFHAVKHVTTAEGGMVVGGNPELLERARRFRNHGITSEPRQRLEQGSWAYEMVELGFNYRLSDVQCALGCSQMSKLPRWLQRRRELAALYDRSFAGSASVRPLKVSPEVEHAYHLYVVRVPRERRQRAFAGLRQRGIGANVHYIPVHFHPYYRARLRTGPGLCPVAESAYEEILTLPLFPAMTEGDVARVVAALAASLG